MVVMKNKYRMNVHMKRRTQMKRRKLPMSGRQRVTSKERSCGMRENNVKKNSQRIRRKRRKVITSKARLTKRKAQSKRRKRRISTKTSAKERIKIKAYSSGYSQTGPCDQGWAWLVLLGGTIWFILFSGTLRSFGIFYVIFQEWFHGSPSDASTVGLLFGIMQIITAPVSGLVADYGNNRIVLVICGLAASLGIVVTSQTSSLTVAMISFGVISGAAVSVLDVTVVSMVGKYFKKYRTFSNSVMNASGGIGTLVIPQVHAATQEAFNARTAVLTIGGLWLNACVVGALMRPIDLKKVEGDQRTVFNDTTRRGGWSKEDEKCVVEMTKHMDKNSTKEPNKYVKYRAMRLSSELVQESTMTYVGSTANRTQVAVIDENNLVGSLYQTTDSSIEKGIVARRIYVLPEEDTKNDVKKHSLLEEVDCPEKEAYFASKIESCWVTVKSYCSLLKNAGLMVRILSLNLSWFAGVLPIVAIPPLCKELNIDIHSAANLITVSGCLAILSLVIIGYASERFKWRPVLVTAFSTSVPAAISVIVIFLPRYDVLMIFSCFHGLFSAVAFSLLNTITTEAVDISDLGHAMALFMAVNGAGAALLTPTVGLVQEAYGTNRFVFAVSASAALLGNILYISILSIESKRKDGK